MLLSRREACSLQLPLANLRPASGRPSGVDFECAQSRTVAVVTITDVALDPSRLDQALCRLVDVPDGAAVDQPAFTISEAVDRTGVGAHTLRYYERVGLIDDVPRTGGGQRLYTLRSLGRIVFLSRMRATGMSIDSLRTYVELIRAGEQTSPERRELLEAHRRDVIERIATLQEAVAILDLKIDDYRIWEQQQ